MDLAPGQIEQILFKRWITLSNGEISIQCIAQFTLRAEALRSS